MQFYIEQSEQDHCKSIEIEINIFVKIKVHPFWKSSLVESYSCDQLHYRRGEHQDQQGAEHQLHRHHHHLGGKPSYHWDVFPLTTKCSLDVNNELF